MDADLRLSRAALAEDYYAVVDALRQSPRRPYETVMMRLVVRGISSEMYFVIKSLVENGRVYKMNDQQIDSVETPDEFAIILARTRQSMKSESLNVTQQRRLLSLVATFQDAGCVNQCLWYLASSRLINAPLERLLVRSVFPSDHSYELLAPTIRHYLSHWVPNQTLSNSLLAKAARAADIKMVRHLLTDPTVELDLTQMHLYNSDTPYAIIQMVCNALAPATVMIGGMTIKTRMSLVPHMLRTHLTADNLMQSSYPLDNAPIYQALLDINIKWHYYAAYALQLCHVLAKFTCKDAYCLCLNSLRNSSRIPKALALVLLNDGSVDRGQHDQHNERVNIILKLLTM